MTTYTTLDLRSEVILQDVNTMRSPVVKVFVQESLTLVEFLR